MLVARSQCCERELLSMNNEELREYYTSLLNGQDGGESLSIDILEARVVRRDRDTKSGVRSKEFNPFPVREIG